MARSMTIRAPKSVSRVWKRSSAIVALSALALALAAPAGAESRSKCRQMSRQIEHYLEVRAMAHQRGKALWQRSTERHLLHLEARQQRACPRYLESIKQSKIRQAAEETKAFIRAAALAAARYFAFGF
jgi:hypothetical protein